MEGFGVFLIILLLVVYFVPAVVANSRHHRQLGPIVAVNLLLGWTILGWVAALAWALTTDIKSRQVEQGAATSVERKCPYCAELIRMEAVKCRHCGANVASA
jgi:T4 superinfection immunity protein